MKNEKIGKGQDSLPSDPIWKLYCSKQGVETNVQYLQTCFLWKTYWILSDPTPWSEWVRQKTVTCPLTIKSWQLNKKRKKYVFTRFSFLDQLGHIDLTSFFFEKQIDIFYLQEHQPNNKNYCLGTWRSSKGFFCYMWIWNFIMYHGC